MTRPILAKELAVETFLKYYYLKSELVDFCRENQLVSHGSKAELTEVIAHFLKTGGKNGNH